MVKSVTADWALVAATPRDIAQLRAHCRRMVRRRAAIAAGVSALPLPGVEVMSDLSLFALLVEDVNQAFGLSPDQVARLQPRLRLVAYQAAASMGGMMVGKFVTRELAQQVLQRAGLKGLARPASKVLPLAGRIAAVAIGFAVFRQMGYQHVDACAAVAGQMLDAGAL